MSFTLESAMRASIMPRPPLLPGWTEEAERRWLEKPSTTRHSWVELPAAERSTSTGSERFCERCGARLWFLVGSSKCTKRMYAPPTRGAPRFEFIKPMPGCRPTKEKP